MDESLYDEFGNFIGQIESDAESDASGDEALHAHEDAYLDAGDEDDGEEPVQEEQSMQVDGVPPALLPPG